MESEKDLKDLKHFASSAKRNKSDLDTQLGRSLMYTINRRGPRILPWGTPDKTGSGDE